jgi:hypothetical protein
VRWVRWVGSRISDYLDQPDPADRWGRTRRTLLYADAYSREVARRVRREAAIAQRFRPIAGVTVREFGPDALPGLREVYRWGVRGMGPDADAYGPAAFVAWMDDHDATVLMLSKFGHEFAYADDEDPTTAGREPRQDQPGDPVNQGRGPAATGLVLARLLDPVASRRLGSRALTPEEMRRVAHAR